MNRIVIRSKYFIIKVKKYLDYILKKDKINLTNSKKVYIFLSADYGNLGDVAITYAQKNYIKSILPEYEVVEIPSHKTYSFIFYLKNHIKNEDIITIIGGGNLTNIYDGIEEARRTVVKTFRNNIIISFPQTIEFTNDSFGQDSLKRTISIYSKHKNLILFARENKSYEMMKKIFTNNKVYICPDIVMSLKEKINNENVSRNKIGICLRNDKERLINDNTSHEIIEICKKNNIEYITTHIGDENFIYDKRYELLFDLLNNIRNCKVFITDRLHGMIFCYLTETPCIAFDNNNHKIRETYNKWLKNCNYIYLIEENEAKDINQYIKKMENIEKIDVNLVDKFNEMEKILLEAKSE